MGEPEIKEFFFTLVHNYGAIGIFISLILEYLALPIPGESLMLMLGYISSWSGETASCIIMAALGTFTGSIIAYSIGYRFGEGIVLKVGKPFHITKEKLDKTNKLLLKHDCIYIIFSRFIPGIRHIVPYMTGISKLNIYKNILLNLLSAFIWCSVFIIAGHIVGEQWSVIENYISEYTIIALLLLIFIIIVIIYIKRHRAAIIAFSVSATVFVFICVGMMENKLAAFDDSVYDFMEQHISSGLTGFMIVISSFGSFPVLFISAAILFFLLWRKKEYYYAKMSVINLSLISLLNLAFKLLFQRERPLDTLQLITASGFSFPSSHTMVGMGFWGYLIYLCLIFFKGRQRWISIIILGLLILTVGVSRVYLGVHYASDVAGGILAGISWLSIFITVTDIFRKKWGGLQQNGL